MIRISKCKGCGADIVWLKTARGKMMPCDDKVERLVTHDENGRNAKIVAGRRPHRGTCPKADDFKKKRNG